MDCGLWTQDLRLETQDFRVAHVSPQRQQSEQRAQDVLPLRNPGHRFHRQRVPAEQARDYEARPAPARDPQQQCEEKAGIGDVQQQVGHMMAPRPQTVQLAIQHVGEQRHRMPIGGFSLPQRPAETGPRNPSLDVLVLGHVSRVVKVDEVIPRDRPIDGQGDRGQQPGHEGRGMLQRSGHESHSAGSAPDCQPPHSG